MLVAAAVVLALRRPPYTSRVLSGILALFWLWMGAVYHLMFFSAVNPAANVFGALFIAQGLLFAAAGVWRPTLTFRWRGDAYGIVGGLLML